VSICYLLGDDRLSAHTVSLWKLTCFLYRIS